MTLIPFYRWDNWAFVRLTVLLRIIQHVMQICNTMSEAPFLRMSGPSKCEVLGLGRIHRNKTDLHPFFSKESQVTTLQCEQKTSKFPRTQDSSTLFYVLQCTWAHSLLTHHEVVRASILTSEFIDLESEPYMCAVTQKFTQLLDGCSTICAESVYLHVW